MFYIYYPIFVKLDVIKSLKSRMYFKNKDIIITIREF